MGGVCLVAALTSPIWLGMQAMDMLLGELSHEGLQLS